MKIFISDSRYLASDSGKQPELPTEVCRRLDKLMEDNIEILSGDDLDSLVQEYLHSARYPKVTVYVSGGKRSTRHNAGRWDEKHIRPPCNKGYGYFIEKDFAMAQDADQGLVVWNGESNGSFVDLVNLAVLGKECDLYLLSERKWVAIRSIEDIKPFVPPPGELGDDDYESVLKDCGFSDEMREYLISNHFISGHKLIDAIRTAPVSLEKKMDMLVDLCQKRSLKHEVYDTVCKNIENGADFRVIKRKIRSLWGAPASGSIWADAWNAHEEIRDARWDLISCAGPAGDSDRFLYLFSEWYDTDTFTEKSSPEGVFRSPWQVFKYIRGEDKEAYDADGRYYRLESWDARDMEREQPMYDYYIYGGEICWFDKREPEKQENGNSYYLPVNRHYSWGELDLNLSTPFRTGDIVNIDCRPFGPPFHAVILEAGCPYDCCFPNILFQIPYTDTWAISSLKHKHFFKDAEDGTREPMLSPLYRLRTMTQEEMSESDEPLLKIKELLSGDEEKAERLWELWNKTEPEAKTFGQMMELLGNL